MPRISVIIPAYNAAETILNALDSAQSQTFDDIEIIVIDDASTDATFDLVQHRSMADPRIHLYRLEKNSGPAAARNQGIAVAKGEWIALLDADDSIASYRLERLLGAASAEDVLVADNLVLYDRHAGKTVKLGISPELLGTGLCLDCEDYAGRCKSNQTDAVDFGLLKPLIRVSHLLKHSIRYDERSRYAEDFRFYLDILLVGGKLRIIPEALYQYTERLGSISNKRSGLSKTVTERARLEAQTRELARDPHYARVAAHLTERADAIQKLAKVDLFGRRSRVNKLISLPLTLADRDMRAYLKLRARTHLDQLRPSEWMKSPLIRDSSNLCVGQFIRLGLQGIYFLFIARSLGPSQYGAFVAIMAMTSIVSPYVGLGCGNLFLKNVRSGKRVAPVCWGNGLIATVITGLLTLAAICGYRIFGCHRYPLRWWERSAFLI